MSLPAADEQGNVEGEETGVEGGENEERRGVRSASTRPTSLKVSSRSIAGVEVDERPKISVRVSPAKPTSL